MKHSAKIAFGAVALATVATVTGCSTNFYEKQQKQILDQQKLTYADCKDNQDIMRAGGKGGFTKNDACYDVLYGGFSR